MEKDPIWVAIDDSKRTLVLGILRPSPGHAANAAGGPRAGILSTALSWDTIPDSGGVVGRSGPIRRRRAASPGARRRPPESGDAQRRRR